MQAIASAPETVQGKLDNLDLALKLILGFSLTAAVTGLYLSLRRR